jgi:hypothetical protein
MDIVQMMRERAECEITAVLLGDTCSTSSVKPNSNSVYTLEMLEKTIDEVESIHEKPFKDLLRDKGFDPEQDILIFSVKAAEAIGLTKDNMPRRMKDQIKINPMVDFGNVYLLKNPAL